MNPFMKRLNEKVINEGTPTGVPTQEQQATELAVSSFLSAYDKPTGKQWKLIVLEAQQRQLRYYAVVESVGVYLNNIHSGWNAVKGYETETYVIERIAFCQMTPNDFKCKVINSFDKESEALEELIRVCNEMANEDNEVIVLNEVKQLKVFEIASIPQLKQAGK